MANNSKKGLSYDDKPFFEFEVESLIFDVDAFKFKTSNIKEKGPSHDGRSLRATVPF